MQYEVPEEHACLLRTMLGVGVADSIPEAVTKAYYSLRKSLDRINHGFPVEMLATVVALSGLALQADITNDGPRDWSVVRPGTIVLAGSRAGRFLSTELKGKQGQKKLVLRIQFDDGPDGLFDPDDVQVAEEAEAMSV